MSSPGSGRAGHPAGPIGGDPRWLEAGSGFTLLLWAAWVVVSGDSLGDHPGYVPLVRFRARMGLDRPGRPGRGAATGRRSPGPGGGAAGLLPGRGPCVRAAGRRRVAGGVHRAHRRHVRGRLRVEHVRDAAAGADRGADAPPLNPDLAATGLELASKADAGPGAGGDRGLPGAAAGLLPVLRKTKAADAPAGIDGPASLKVLFDSMQAELVRVRGMLGHYEDELEQLRAARTALTAQVQAIVDAAVAARVMVHSLERRLALPETEFHRCPPSGSAPWGHRGDAEVGLLETARTARLEPRTEYTAPRPPGPEVGPVECHPSMESILIPGAPRGAAGCLPGRQAPPWPPASSSASRPCRT